MIETRPTAHDDRAQALGKILVVDDEEAVTASIDAEVAIETSRGFGYRLTQKPQA